MLDLAVRLIPRSRSLTDRALTRAASASSSCVSPAAVLSCRSSSPKLTGPGPPTGRSPPARLHKWQSTSYTRRATRHSPAGAIHQDPGLRSCDLPVGVLRGARTAVPPTVEAGDPVGEEVGVPPGGIITQPHRIGKASFEWTDSRARAGRGPHGQLPARSGTHAGHWPPGQSHSRQRRPR